MLPSASISSFPALTYVTGALPIPAANGVMFDLDGDNLDGQKNATLADGASLTSVFNAGSLGGTFTPPGTAPKAKITANSSGKFGSVLYAGGDILHSTTVSTFVGPTVVAVIVKIAASGNATIVGGLGSPNFGEVNMSAASVSTFAGSTGPTIPRPPDVGSYNVIVANFQGASSWCDLNDPFDAHDATGNPGTELLNGVVIGGNAALTLPLPAGSEIVRAIWWDGVVPNSSQDIMDYFYSRYGAGWSRPNLFKFTYTGTEPTPGLSIVGGDKVGWVGDSISQGVPVSGTDSWYVPAQAAITAGLTLAPNFSPLGVGGNKTADVLTRMSTILAQGCTVFVTEIGINDFGQAPWVPVETFMSNLFAIDAAYRVAGVLRRAYISPLCRHETFPNPIERRLIQYVSAMNHFCAAVGATFVDVHAAALAFWAQFNIPAPGNIQSPGPLGQTLLTQDGVHPDHLLLGPNLMSNALMARVTLSG